MTEQMGTPVALLRAHQHWNPERVDLVVQVWRRRGERAMAGSDTVYSWTVSEDDAALGDKLLMALQASADLSAEPMSHQDAERGTQALAAALRLDPRDVGRRRTRWAHAWLVRDDPGRLWTMSQTYDGEARAKKHEVTLVDAAAAPADVWEALMDALIAGVVDIEGHLDVLSGQLVELRDACEERRLGVISQHDLATQLRDGVGDFRMTAPTLAQGFDRAATDLARLPEGDPAAGPIIDWVVSQIDAETFEG